LFSHDKRKWQTRLRGFTAPAQEKSKSHRRFSTLTRRDETVTSRQPASRTPPSTFSGGLWRTVGVVDLKGNECERHVKDGHLRVV
jgi:hypothetical protein